MHAVPASHLARTLPHRDRKAAGGAQPIRYAGFVRSRSPVVRRARATGDMRPTGRAQHSRVTEARAEAAERPGVEPASAGQVDVGRQAGRPGRAPPVLAPEGTERRRKSSGAAGDRRDRLRRERWSAPETPTAGRRGVWSGPSAHSTRPALPMLPRPRPVRRQRRAPGRGTTGPRSAVVARRTAAHLRVDLPDVDGARVLGDRGKNRRVVEAPAGCPSPQRNWGARPPRTTTGEPLKCAVATPDTPLVPLGPAVRTGRRPGPIWAYLGLSGPIRGSRLGR